MIALRETQILSSEQISQLSEQAQHELRQAYGLYVVDYANDAEEQAEAEAWLDHPMQEDSSPPNAR